MSSVLIQRLTNELGYPLVDGPGADAFVDREGEAVLFLSGDPVRYKEADDVAVVLPELLKALGGDLRAAVVHRDAEKEVASRLGVTVWPALAFFRGGEHLGNITRMQDWGVYLERIAALRGTVTEAR